MTEEISNVIQLIKGFFDEIITWFRKNQPYLHERATQYARLMRIDRPIGTLLLLWPTLWALWIAAQGTPTMHLLLVFICGVFLTRSAGCVINDYADRNLDLHVERTRLRPMTTGNVTGKEAFYIILVLLGIAFLMVLTTNRLTILLSFVALPLGGIYPFMKRYTYVPQFFMGIAFSWGIPMAFAATLHTIPAYAWLLFTANILWSMTYDTIYAIVDREHDKKIGIKSTAILFEGSDREFLAVFQVLMLLTLALVGKQLEFGPWYYFALVATAALFIYHQFLIKDADPEKCFRAFLHNNWAGAVVFAGIVLNYTS